MDVGQMLGPGLPQTLHTLRRCLAGFALGVFVLGWAAAAATGAWLEIAWVSKDAFLSGSMDYWLS